MKEEEKKAVKVAGITDAQIQEWKQKYGVIKKIELYKSGSIEPFEVYAKKPSRKVISEYFRWMDKDLNKATDILIKGCCLNGIDEIIADDELFFTATSGLSELLPIGRAEIKNC